MLDVFVGEPFLEACVAFKSSLSPALEDAGPSENPRPPQHYDRFAMEELVMFHRIYR
jgi:hypothetical protein